MKYLSYGAGVGSTALICYMLPEIRSGEIEVVYVNHGCDMPENKAYLEYIKGALDIPITVIAPDIGTREGERFNNLYDYYIFKRICPSIHIRSCTFRGKIEPFNQYIQRPATVYLGITYDEKHRVHKAFKKYRTDLYPMVDAHISRTDGIELIKQHGLKVPVKSGCFFCPFQSRKQWGKLYEQHPDLFARAIYLEQNAKKPNTYLLPNRRSLEALGIAFSEQQKICEVE